ncbi:MAG: hypothetical protein ACT6Q8_16655 [Niveispirillum sp.]|uniref:hypothetical protein n=1 Tax=Niveispirillum sp. TaxID=1917217 RepID=UPI0040357B3F
MSEPAAREKPDFIEKIADYAGWILAVSVAVIIAAWSLYFFQFRGGLSNDTATWGQFGDFVGGTLNSVFAFFSFMILLSSLRLQLKELRLTRQELEATRTELAASSEAQKMQAKHFEREAKKKDHTEAIQFLIDRFPKNFAFSIVHDLDGKDRQINGAFIGKNDPNLKKDGFYINLLENCEKIEMLDYHCYQLKGIFPESPILYLTINHFFGLTHTLIDYDWLDKQKLPFFFKPIRN